MTNSQSHVPYDFVTWWVIRSICGCVIGTFIVLLPILAIVAIGSGLRFRDNIILSTWQLWIIIGVPIYGAFIGNLQWETLLSSFISRKRWILTSAISTAMGVASFFFALDILPPLQSLLANGERTVSNTWLSRYLA